MGYHSFATIFGIMIFAREDWWYPSNGGVKNFWIGYPNHTLDPYRIWYILIQCAYNLDALVSLLLLSFELKFDKFKFPFINIKWADTVRGDFNEMFAHHLITNALCFAGSAFRLTRSVVATYFVHDLSDIPVDLSKMVHFMRWKKSTICMFIMLILTWTICRMIILPFVIYRSILYDSVFFLQGSLKAEIITTYYPLFVVLCAGIILLHYVWFVILLRIGYVLVSKGETHDLSEHKKGEKNETQKSTDELKKDD